ncbi:hypothetical protein SteCoe_1303 [Stentor coeruleus]|uniref:Tetratricopeptide SHNi-TPR domain-containing protein n=1 Tax=Stentor coeruleus TaxID=5963 RepID=A0A1R2D2C5_9CILI|nr:hypothetical protein SteCoe_1303 [Stentor coeruleus]
MEDLTKKAELPNAMKEYEKDYMDVVITETSPQKTQNPEEIYNEGLECIKSGRIEYAIESLLSKALEIATTTYGELDKNLYKYYYAYADALIFQYEKENEGKIFGEAVPEQVACSMSSSQMAEEGSSSEVGSLSNEEFEENEQGENENPSEEQVKIEGGLNQKEENDEEGSEDDSFSPEDNEFIQPENPPENTDEKTDDLQLAWESLESARVILKNNENLDMDYLIKVITRLGDLLSYKEDFEKACQEYNSALSLQITIEGDKPSRTKASLHFLLGNNFMQIRGKELEAADNFDKALEYMTFIMDNAKNEDERSELVEIIKEIRVKKEDALEQKESLKALQELDVNPNSFDVPQMENVVDLGVIKKKKPENEEEDIGEKKRLDE